MRKVLLVLVFCVASIAAVSAAGLYVTPSADISVGVNNYLRGGSVGSQAFYDFGFLALGLEARADYDLTFNVFNVPVMLLIGFGRDFWISAGYTIPLSAPYLLASDGSHAEWALGGFPNTYALGVNALRLPTPIGALLVRSQISYIVNNPVNANDPVSQGFGTLISILAGFKAEVGVGLELRAL